MRVARRSFLKGLGSAFLCLNLGLRIGPEKTVREEPWQWQQTTPRDNDIWDSRVYVQGAANRKIVIMKGQQLGSTEATIQAWMALND